MTQPNYYPPSNDALSGVFGFAYPSDELKDLALVNNFATQNQLPNSMSIWLPNSIYDSGVLTIGDVNPNLYNGTINYVPLLDSTWAKRDYPFFWSNVVSDIKVNGKS